MTNSQVLSRRLGFALAVGVLLLAAGLRLWHIASLPPGLYHDEAFLLLEGQKIARGVELPIYITGNNGNEPLFPYLCAVMTVIMGPVPWAGRLLAAWVGIIGIACTVRAGEALTSRRGLGLLAGALLAVFYWHIDISRFGSLFILSATAAAGALAAFWHGVRTKRYRAFAIAGVCLGAGLLSYPPFRVFPLVMLAAGIAALVTRPCRRQILLGGLVTVGVALVIYAPLGWFFIQHPEWFVNRLGQTLPDTSTLPAQWAFWLSNTAKMLGGLFLSGDANWRHNLPPRPAFDLAQALFFMVGLGACLRQWRQPASWVLGAWFLVGLLPSILTLEAPHFGRTALVTPALALLMALGFQTVWQWARPRVVRAILLLALACSGGLTLWDYFVRWPADPSIVPAFNTQQVWIAQALRTAPAGAWLYVTPLDYREDYWTYEFFLGSDAFQRFRVFNGRECLIMPAETRAPALYAVVTGEDRQTLPALNAAFPAGWRSEPDLPSGESYFSLYHIPAGQTARLAMQVNRPAQFGDLARLLGYTLPTDFLQPGSALRVKLFWAGLQPTAAPYKVFIHLIGPARADGSVIYAQRDIQPCANSYPTTEWRADELVVDTYTLDIPADLPPGEYTLQTGWYDPVSGAHLPAETEAGPAPGDAVQLQMLSTVSP